jgi:23S rRNA pseudouridine1911/1915/1917 synthase
VGGEIVHVELTAPPDESLEPESIPLSVAYEDADMLIVDKPAGLVVHPSAGHGSGTLVNALLGRARDRGEPLGSIAGVGRPGIVHRLDKETSGLIVVAKTDLAQAALMRQFGDRSIEKEYLALVRGATPAPRGRIEAPIGRDPRDRQRMSVVAGGRDSVTEYEQIAEGGGYALVSLRPLTGRTHQIRAHLAYLGLPIAGDLRYGGGEGPGGLRRQFLHAARLGLVRPSDGAKLRAWSPLPPDLAACLEASGVVPPPGRLPVEVGSEVEAA